MTPINEITEDFIELLNGMFPRMTESEQEIFVRLSNEYYIQKEQEEEDSGF